MATHTSLPIYKVAYDLLDVVTDLVANMQRNFKRSIGMEELLMPDGSRIERGISTTSLSVGEFANLIEAVSAWAQTELNVDL